MIDKIEVMLQNRPITMIASKNKLTERQIYQNRAATCRSFGLMDRAVIYDILARKAKI
jgi:hypothetical protein